MKTIEEYDKHLQDFYGQSFRDYALKHGMQDAEKYSNDMLKSYSTAINNSIAKELLKNINMQFPTLEDKLDNYPILFWKSKEGENILSEMGGSLNTKAMDYLYNKPNLNVEDIKNAFEKITTIAFKISLKNEKDGIRLVQSFESNLNYMLGHKVEEKQIESTLAKELRDNAIKQSLNPNKLESHYTTFPELAHVLGSMLNSAKTEEERKTEVKKRRTLKVN